MSLGVASYPDSLYYQNLRRDQAPPLNNSTVPPLYDMHRSNVFHRSLELPPQYRMLIWPKHNSGKPQVRLKAHPRVRRQRTSLSCWEL